MNSKKGQFHIRRLRFLLLGLVGACTAGIATAQEGEEDVQPTPWALEGVPGTANTAIPPLSQNLASDKMIMLTLSVDHQLFFEAYNDFDDIYAPIAEDGRPEAFEVPEISYTHAFVYTGYFDPNLCYSYTSTTAGGRFKATAPATNRYCNDTEGNGGGWSGNFLNWATMTRMDMVRFVLYGGYRSIDTANSGSGSNGQTVLERAYLPQDAHSFAKYYAGDDIDELTDGLPNSCDGAEGQCEGYTFCATTKTDETLRDKYSQDAEILALPPLMRAVKGNYSLWASNERYQCLPKDEIPKIDRTDPVESELDNRGHNGNIPGLTGINAFGNPPTSAQVVDYEVNVEVCSPVAGAVRESFCQEYAGGNYKPVGLLQEQGGAGEVKFGLLTGSYSANKSFGALRKTVSDFSEEVEDDGRFVYPPLRQLVAGNSTPPSALKDSIIGNLNALRIIDYKFRSEGGEAPDRWRWSGTYHRNDRVEEAPNCFWEQTSFKNGQCRNWGNPLSEMLAESYLYFAKGDKLAVGEDGDEGLVPGLTVAAWHPPADEVGETGETTGGTSGVDEFACANLNVVAFNSSSVSYDNGEEHDSDTDYKNLAGQTTASLFGLGTENDTVAALTDIVGGVELDTSKQYFIGKVAGVGDEQCTAKSIPGNNLSSVAGTCPEAPTADGSYWGAGLANFAHTSGVTSDKRTVTTYGVNLAGALPKINVRVPNVFDEVQIIPACRNLGTGSGGFGNCSLVDFKPVQVLQKQGDRYTAKYYVGWEDSEQGGDYDLDLSGTISLTFAEVDGALKLDVATHITYESSNSQMEFGFIVSGTDNDGPHFPSRITADAEDGPIDDIIKDGSLSREERIQRVAEFKRVDEDTITGECTGKSYCNSADNRQIQITTLTPQSGSTATLLEPPLYYAAKWGAYKDTNGNRIVDSGEWDGASYAEVADPSRLKYTLNKVIDSIIDKPVAGTGAAAATTALTGEGVILSTLFVPTIGDGNAKTNWIGRLNGLFRADGENWEDSSTPYGVRTDDDNIVRFRLEGEKTVFDRYKASRDDYGNLIVPAEPVQRGIDYNKLMPVWNAGDQLAALSQEAPANPNNGVAITKNRDYNKRADTGRYIFTSVAAHGDGYTTGADVLAFVAGQFGPMNANANANANATADGLGANNYRLLDVTNATNAAKVVDFIRGKEGIEGFRNRTVTMDGDEKTWLLGDIIHSTPALVGRPNALYDSSRLSDSSYSTFRDHYANRRLVTYVGANDGMLHAFNGGFASVSTDDLGNNSLQYARQPPAPADAPATPSTVTAHPLGAELWSYVPYNLLPQLKWLTNPSYRHMYYVDSSVNQFDVNIFEHSTTHPEGWGTIIVVGMRFGGSEATIDVDGEGEERTFRSAYMIFDVTNPEVEPTLLGEISHEDLGHTIGDIDVISFRDPHSSGSYDISGGTKLSRNQWYLLFGSGPQSISDAASNKTAKLFSLDLTELRPQSAAGALALDNLLQVVDLDEENSYVGGITAVDWNDDLDDDMIYFGTVGTGTGEGDPKGSLMQASLTYANGTLAITPSKLLQGVDLPFSREPLAIKESAFGGYWVYASSGKFLVQGHLDDIDDNGVFGIRVNNPAPGPNDKRWLTDTPVMLTSLKDVTDYTVDTALERDAEGNVVDRTFTVDDGIAREDVLTPESVSMEIREDNQGWVRWFGDGELSDTRPFYSGSTLGVTTFLPSTSGCSPSGKSRLYILNLFNGLPQTENQQMLLRSDGGTEVVNVDSGEEGEVVPFMEFETKLNDTAKSGDLVVPCTTGCFVNPPIEEPPAIPTRRSWREVPMDDLGL